jgi:hypothetical protein
MVWRDRLWGRDCRCSPGSQRQDHVFERLTWPNAIALPQRDADGVVVSQSAVLELADTRDLRGWKEAKRSVIVMKL